MAANLLVAAASNFTSTSTNMSSSSASTTSFPSLLLSSSSLSSSSSSSSSSATFSDSEYFDQDMEVLAPPALRNFVDKGGGSLAGGVVGSGDGASSSLNQFASANMTIEDFRAFLLEANMSPSYRSARATRHSVIIAFYSAIVLVSLFGNLFVCYVITKRRRMRTRTNFLMANMAVSDLMIASITIPMTIARILLSEWPFGSLLCIVVPLVQVTSV
ncbi:neuropeptide Y receptor [Tyrophagus putrescentiae]|nr:neuropeptide Y receptor [Tyrophagus putrescentiae]